MSGDLQNAISLIKSGHKEEGQAILIQILEDDPQNEKAWIWMSAVVDTDEMRLECLEEVLKINPNNQAAQKGAAKLREKLPPQEPVFEDEFVEEADSAFEDNYDDGFEEDDGWYDPIEPEPVTGSKEEYSYDNYAAEPNLDIEPAPSKAKTTEKQSFLTHSPWATIWYRPRLTIRAIIESNPKRDVILIAILFGLLGFFPSITIYMQGDFLFLLLGMFITFIGGPIFGIVWLYVTGAILGFTGMMLGGKGTGAEVRAAIAWGYVPILVGIALTTPFLMVVMLMIPNSQEFMMNPTASLSAFSMIGSCLFFLSVPISLYGFYFVFLQSLAEAQQFSGWRAFGSVLLPGLLLTCTLCGLSFVSQLAMAM